MLACVKDYRQGALRSGVDATDISAGKVARALILLGVAGLPLKDSDVLPGCGDLTVFDVRARGFTFGQALSHILSPEDPSQPTSVNQPNTPSQVDRLRPGWAAMPGFQLLNLPLVFVYAFDVIAINEESGGTSPVELAYRIYRNSLAPLLFVDTMSSVGLEKITFAHLAVRIAVAKAWASSRPVPVRVPAYHVLGTDLPDWLERAEFEATDAALPMPAPSAAVQDWSVDNPTSDIRLQGHDVLYKVQTTPGSAPFLLLSAAQKASFDIMMSLQPTVGRRIVVLIDCAFTSDSTKFVSNLSNCKDLPSKIGQLEQNQFFQGAVLVPCLVTNRPATLASRMSYVSNKVVLVASNRLDHFFSPTLAPLIRSLGRGACCHTDLFIAVGLCYYVLCVAYPPRSYLEGFQT